MARAISCFCQPVGIQKNGVTALQCQAINREARVTEHAQRHSRRILCRHSVDVDVKKREMTCANKLNRTIVCSSSYHEGRKLSGKSAFAENAIGVFHHPIERETGLREAAKRCVEVAHEHRRSHALAGNIAQHKEQAAVCFDKVAVIAAHHAGGLIVEAHVPPCWR